MVRLSEDGTIQATVRDITGGGTKKQDQIKLAPGDIVAKIIADVANIFDYHPETFELMLQNKMIEAVVLNEHQDKTLEEVGVSFDSTVRNFLIISPAKVNKKMTLVVSESNLDDDLLLGASASPTTGEIPSSSTDPLPLRTNYMNKKKEYINRMYIKPILDMPNYVGLVNQAMTCYLNSLLQALFMTPEFRNALYNWEFDGQNDESKSIPFQLQKLFLNLQTSTKSAVETTELTHSFGWKSSEAWQQHDIQELCRVMFDALEQKFKDTEQANLINDLYEGKMFDYVKCLECSTEKSREDTFLDIPLPVRFGSTAAYNSVEEALRAFVQPETLEGNNQYHCEKCNKKCDAHKGLKFTKFPYLLTLHLKRFDFDYSTMHRIKLNDKVAFSEVLNLNSFISNGNEMNYNEGVEDRETLVKCDDSSTTDSGSALDDENCQVTDISSSVNDQDDNCQDDDEGIDMSSVCNHHENEKNRRLEPKGPYLYELFSIMIHSGSASGGHYYAYIKDFQKDQWFCFNDQSVSRVTDEDIAKTYGGGQQRGYYSGAYSSSTNAYMLMYRQIDKDRNCNAMSVDDFPPHIKRLLHQMREKEEFDRIAKEKESEMFKCKVYCYHPVHKQLIEKTLYLLDNVLPEFVKAVYQKFKLEGVVPLEDCRLVSYNKVQDCIDCSFDDDNWFYSNVVCKLNHQNDLLLEIRQPGTEFQIYKPGGKNMKVFYVNLETEEVDGPTNIRVNAGETVWEFKIRVAKMLNVPVNTLQVVQETYSNERRYLDENDIPMKFDPAMFYRGYKIYVSNSSDEDVDKKFIVSKLNKVIERFVHIITIDIELPDTDRSTLEMQSIPPLNMNQNLDKNELLSGEQVNGSPNLRISPQPGGISEGFGDQSNSEDSSLSDSDRTLVGEAPGDCLGLLSSSSNSPADQHMASPSDPAEDSYNHEIFGNPFEQMHWDDEETPEPLQRGANYYFKVVQISNLSTPDNLFVDSDSPNCCRVFVDRRMNLAKLKRNLEPVVGVPVEYFKIYRQNSQQYPNQDNEWSRLTDSLIALKEGERLTVKLGRVLRKDEYSVKIYHLTPDNSEPFSLLFEWIIAKGQSVGQVKAEICVMAKKQHMLNIPFSKCRLRKKNWKNPCKVFLDEQKFVDDIPLHNNFDVFLQELPDPEKVTSTNQLVLFVKRWHPCKLTLSRFHEVILDEPTMDELRSKLSERSYIPLEYVDVAYAKSTFPCNMNVLDIHGELDWNPNVTHLESWPLQVHEDGSVFIYRDSREQLKELTLEEKMEISLKENARLGKYSTKTYSPRRECALKIYVDTSPNKSEESCGD